MVDLRLGTADVQNVYRGATKAKALYLGSTKVWPQFGFVAASSTFSSTTTGGISVSSSSTFPVNMPAGSVAGDLLIAQYHFGYNTSLGTAPAFSLSGWTVLASYRPGTNTPPYSIATLWAWHTGASVVNFPVTGSNGVTGGCHVGVVAIRGAHPTSPIASSAGISGQSGKANTTTLVSAGLVANQMAVYGFSGAADVSAMNDASWPDPLLTECVDMAGARLTSSNNNCVGSAMAYSGVAAGAVNINNPVVNTTTQRLHRHGCGVLIQGA